MINIIAALSQRSRHGLLPACAGLCLLGGVAAHAAPAPFWIDADTRAQAGSIVASGSELRSLLGVGDTVLAHWPAQDPGRSSQAGSGGFDPSPQGSAGTRQAPACAGRLPAAKAGTRRYHILRELPARIPAGDARHLSTAATMAPGVLVQPVGTATAAASMAPASLASTSRSLLAIAQAADAIRPGDLLLPLDSPAIAPVTAPYPPSSCMPP